MLTILQELTNYRLLPRYECGKCTCGWLKILFENYQTYLVFKFLNGLNESYSTIRSQILLRKPFSRLGEAHNAIRGEEIQRNTKNATLGVEETPIMDAVLV